MKLKIIFMISFVASALLFSQNCYAAPYKLSFQHEYYDLYAIIVTDKSGTSEKLDVCNSCYIPYSDIILEEPEKKVINLTGNQLNKLRRSFGILNSFYKRLQELSWGPEREVIHQHIDIQLKKLSSYFIEIFKQNDLI